MYPKDETETETNQVATKRNWATEKIEEIEFGIKAKFKSEEARTYVRILLLVLVIPLFLLSLVTID